MKSGTSRSPRGPPEVRQERQEIREYLDKLRQLVPGCPKAGKLSRLAVIQHVIDYIVELQDTLVHHPANAAALAAEQDVARLAHVDPLLALQRLSNAHKYPHGAAPLTPEDHKAPSSAAKTSADPAMTAVTVRKNSSSCRRPLGVLSSLKNQRH